MKIVTLDPFDQPTPAEFRGAVLAIGNFDAVHRGHQALLEVARKRANDLGRPFGILTFEPHPRRVFRPDDAPFRVTPYAAKLERFEAAQAEIVFILPFNWTIAHLQADAFIDNILRKALVAEFLVMGSDFRFGQNRSGSVETLREAGFKCTVVDPLKDAQNAVYSATRVRGLLQSGHIDEANALLGWDWEIIGTVVKGDQRGRELGYPTANVALGETIHPAYGVYATWVRIDDEADWHKAATNIGIRPMFESKIALVEAHLLDFSRDIYGKTLHIRVVKKIRDEEKFVGLDALMAQIARDCTQVRSLLEG